MAEIFDTVLRERWEAGEDSASNVAIAERHLQVNEKQVRRWRKPEHAHDKPVPMAALLALPESIATVLVVRLITSRGRAFAMSVFGRLSATLFGASK